MSGAWASGLMKPYCCGFQIVFPAWPLMMSVGRGAMKPRCALSKSDLSANGSSLSSLWLAAFVAETGQITEYCGTIQGIADDRLCGSIQNLGVAPEHRGLGLGKLLLLKALEGFWRAGLGRASLEVTAQNALAVTLYQKLGFRRVKTVYKAVEVAYS